MNYTLALVVVVACWCAQEGQARHLNNNQMDNEIRRNPNGIDYDKRTADWVRIIQPPAPVVSRQAGAYIELECEAIGRPPPTIQWLKGSQPLTENESYEDNMINDNPSKAFAKVSSRLVIHSALPIHEASYTCLAQGGSQVASAKTKVYVTPDESSERNFSQLLAEELLATRNQPRITLYDVIYLDDIGSDVVLPCRVIGNPRPSIIWLNPSEHVIDNDSRTTVLPDGSLRIRNIHWGNMGQYTCVARNSLGQDYSHTFLYPMLAEK